MVDIKHLKWIIFAMITGFGVSFIFGDLLTLPFDLYYLIYFAIISVFFYFYITETNLDLKRWYSRRIWLGVILGLLFAVVMIMNVLSRPETIKLSGRVLSWEIFWRGLVYGLIDGLLLTVLPWIVTWRAFRVEEKPFAMKIVYGLLAWIFIIITTTTYHLGYSDFRSKKVIQANIGNTIMSVPTLLSANPVATPITHAALHISAVIHSPETELFLPPHREK
jgi:hypothetical protein